MRRQSIIRQCGEAATIAAFAEGQAG